MNYYEDIDLVEATEWYMYLLSLDEYSPHALLGVGGSVSNYWRWQFAVDMTFRCLTSGIWEFSVPDFLDRLGLAGVEQFCARLAEFDPFALAEDGEKYWLDSYMTASKVSSDLVAINLISADGPVFSKDFFHEVDRVFALSGAGWADGPKIPISR